MKKILAIILTMSCVFLCGCMHLGTEMISKSKEFSVENTEIVDKKHLVKSVEADFSFVNVDVANLEMLVEQSEKSGYAIYTKEKDVDVDAYFEIEAKTDDGVQGYAIKQIKEDKSNRKAFVMVFFTPHPEHLSVDFKAVNGGFSADCTLKNAAIDVVNGGVNLTGDHSYPIKIDTVNAGININFKKYDAKLELDTVNGVGAVMGQPYAAVGGMKQQQKTFGAGTDSIKIESVNAAVNISDGMEED